MNFKYSLSIGALSVVLLASCLKSKDDTGLLKDQGSIVIDIQDVAGNNYHQTDQVISFTTSPTQETISLFTVAAYSPRNNKPASDVRVKLTVSPVSGYDPLPAGAFNIPTEVVIPREAGKVSVQVPVNKSLLDLSKNYAATFKITQVSEGIISELGKEITVYFVIKNPYDADYTVTGFLFHPSAPRALSLTKHLSTLGPTRVAGPVGDLGGSNFFFAFDVDASNNLVNFAALGSTPPPPASGFFSADNPGSLAYPGPELPGSTPYMHTTYNNKYDPATKTFFMHYGYGTGSTSQNGWSRQVYEKWVRK